MVDDSRCAERLATLDAYGMMASPREAQFDAIVQAAAFNTGAPIAMITLIDDRRQWFKAKQGVTHDGDPIEQSFCARAIEQDDTFVVPDATDDERFRDFPNVTGDPHIRFYAGQPLTMANGVTVGTLCVIDTTAREGLDAEEMAALAVLARRAVAAFEVRRELGADAVQPLGADAWLRHAGMLLGKAAAALEHIEAEVPLAHLEQVIALVDDMLAVTEPSPA